MPTTLSERQEEDKRFADQERQADEERQQRAREKLESIRQADIQNARQAAGQCVLCGQTLGMITRILRKDRHKGCKDFHE